MFTKRHYEALATIIQIARQSGDQSLNRLEELLIDLLKRDNPDFKPDRFRRACIPGANVRARSC